MNMTEAEWGNLFVALGQVPIVDALMNVNAREMHIINELAWKGLDWQQRGFLHIGAGDKADALDFAQRLRIDPATGGPKPTLTDAEQARAACLDWFDMFMNDLAHERG
jgi:hypothetical protein